MPLEFRRGKEALEEKQSRSSGDYTPFLPNIFWKDHQQSRLIWILNPLEDIPRTLTIRPFTKDGRPEYVIARQAEVIGEDHDPIEDEWGYGPSDTAICIAVELTAIKESRHGRERPVSFEVSTRDFERRIRDEDGELTEEREEVTAPQVGVICQSPGNFFVPLASKDANVGPIHMAALQVIRNTPGEPKDTTYDFELFEEKPLDMSGLLDNWENISYLTEDEKDEVLGLLEEAEDEHEEAIIIGAALLDKWLHEHASQEWYDKVAANIDTPAKFKSERYKKLHGESDAKGGKKKDRASRPSQRRTRRAEAVSEEQEPEVQAEETTEEPRRQRRQRRTRETATATETSTEDSGSEEEQPSVKAQVTSVRERMNSLKAQNAERAKAKAA